jgi:tetratricopeptide (TPR) repeat protein
MAIQVPIGFSVCARWWVCAAMLAVALMVLGIFVHPHGVAADGRRQLAQYDQLAQAALATGDWQLALDYYGRIHQLDPATIPQDAYRMGVLYDHLGDRAQAVAMYRAAIAYYPAKQKNIASRTTVAALQARIHQLE